MNGPTPRRLWNYVTRRLRLRSYFQDPGDGRTATPDSGRSATVQARRKIAQGVVSEGNVDGGWPDELAPKSVPRLPRHGNSTAEEVVPAGGPYPALAAGAGSGGSPRQAEQSFRSWPQDRAGRRRHRCRMAHPSGLHPLSAKTQPRETDPWLSTSFGDDQCGGNRTDFTLRCGTLRARR